MDGPTATAGTGLAELPRSGTSFFGLNVAPTLAEGPGQIQWDGQYLTIATGVFVPNEVNVTAINRLQVSGSNAVVVSSTYFTGKMRNAGESWIYNKAIILPFGSNGDDARAVKVGVWSYSAGGAANQVYKPFGKQVSLKGVTISVAPPI